MVLHSQRFEAFFNGHKYDTDIRDVDKTRVQNVPELVLIHGWGLSSIIWQEWLPLLREHCHVTLIDLPGFGCSEAANYDDLDSLLSAIVAQAPAQAVYLGYSLGGMLAVNIAHRYPERAAALITLSSNVKFVADKHWPCGMDLETYQAFFDSVKNKPAQTLKRFSALQVNGARNEKELLKLLRSKKDLLSKDSSGRYLSESLQLLSVLDNRVIINQVLPPSLHVFAENDSLVPVAAAKKIQAEMPGNVVIMPDAPHCLFISEPQSSWDVISQFLQKEKLLLTSKKSRVLDKQQVARSFSRAAPSYDSVAELQRQVGEQLLNYLPNNSAAVVLDLGCGTGFFSSHLQQRFPASTIVGLDLAEGMVTHAAKNQATNAWLCADAENLPLADESVELVFSSLAIQWCEDSEALFAEIFRVLKPGGCFVFSTLGPNTLHELRTAWHAVDNYVHVNRFVDKPVLSAAATEAGFITAIDQPALVEEIITLEYKTLKNMTRELKSLGAHNVNSGRPAGLTGKQRVLRFTEAYEQQRNHRDLLPASYQAWYGVLHKPQLMVDVSEQSKRQHNGRT